MLFKSNCNILVSFLLFLDPFVFNHYSEKKDKLPLIDKRLDFNSNWKLKTQRWIRKKKLFLALLRKKKTTDEDVRNEKLKTRPTTTQDVTSEFEQDHKWWQNNFNGLLFWW